MSIPVILSVREVVERDIGRVSTQSPLPQQFIRENPDQVVIAAWMISAYSHTVCAISATTPDSEANHLNEASRLIRNIKPRLLKIPQNAEYYDLFESHTQAVDAFVNSAIKHGIKVIKGKTEADKICSFLHSIQSLFSIASYG